MANSKGGSSRAIRAVVNFPTVVLSTMNRVARFIVAAISALEGTSGRHVIWATGQYLSYARPGDVMDIDVTVEENLAIFARLYRVKDVPAAVNRTLEIARLTDRRKDAVDKLSGGMRRRLLLARGLVHEPKLLLLDEPTVGLDPQIRTELWTLIDNLRSRGTTILMSTHYIEEAERLFADSLQVVEIQYPNTAVALGAIGYEQIFETRHDQIAVDAPIIISGAAVAADPTARRARWAFTRPSAPGGARPFS